MTAVTHSSTSRAAPDETLPEDLLEQWCLSDASYLGGSRSRTWRVRRGSSAFAVKWLSAEVRSDWRYETRVMAALRAVNWPAPVLTEEPIVRGDGVWRLFAWLPGEPAPVEDNAAEEYARGRLLAEFHAASSSLGVAGQRDGFALPRQTISDPLLDQWLTVHEQRLPEEGRILRAFREAAAGQLADHESDVPSSVIHGDFTRWNLLFDGGALSGILDFEACHNNHLVADFALAWRGDHDEVIRGYDSVRPLSETEWHLVWPTYWAWLFQGVKEMLAEHYSQPGGASNPADLEWQVRHVLKDSDLLRARCGGKRVDGA
jgi:Ser/Thr protein kinase RdoA (MazF antagonist)